MTEEESRYMEWLGGLADVCTRRMTGRVCSYCQCEFRTLRDSGSDPKGEDPRSGAECEASQSGGSEASASPKTPPAIAQGERQ